MIRWSSGENYASALYRCNDGDEREMRDDHIGYSRLHKPKRGKYCPLNGTTYTWRPPRMFIRTGYTWQIKGAYRPSHK